MKTNESSMIKELEELAIKHCQMLEPHDTYPGKFRVNHLYVDGYHDLFFTIRALITVCIMVLENEDYPYSPLIKQPNIHIQAVLELACKMMPYEEGEFLDEIWKLFSEKKVKEPSR